LFPLEKGSVPELWVVKGLKIRLTMFLNVPQCYTEYNTEFHSKFVNKKKTIISTGSMTIGERNNPSKARIRIRGLSAETFAKIQIRDIRVSICANSR
jgi:hypothetical protein